MPLLARLRSRCLLLLLALPAVAAFGTVRASAATSGNEYELKAVMLFNLARFVEWPAKAFADSNSPIVIGIVGRNPFGDVLENAVKGETANGRRLVVEYYDPVKEVRPCHILFIGTSEKPRLPLLLEDLKGRPVLTVSEIDGFTRLRGGMVRFYTNDQNKIRLRLNLDSSRAEGLEISSKLIQVAELDKASSLSPGFMHILPFEFAFSPNPFTTLPFIQ